MKLRLEIRSWINRPDKFYKPISSDSNVVTMKGISLRERVENLMLAGISLFEKRIHNYHFPDAESIDESAYDPSLESLDMAEVHEMAQTVMKKQDELEKAQKEAKVQKEAKEPDNKISDVESSPGSDVDGKKEVTN